MPLKLGGVETDRPQLITYNPEAEAEVKDAIARRTRLLAQGFILKKDAPGEIALDPPAIGPNTGIFRILSQNGDDRLVWDRTDPAQVREAFKKFKDLLAKGYTAFAVLAGGKKGHKLTEFDPSLQEIVLIPATMPG